MDRGLQKARSELLAPRPRDVAPPFAGVQTWQPFTRQPLNRVGGTALHCQHTTSELRPNPASAFGRRPHREEFSAKVTSR
jgi:hypothetical protein